MGRPPARESGPGGALDLGGLRGLHYDGLGAPRDEADAARLYRIAALQGHAEAQFALARLYLTGRGVLPDPGEAARFFRLAAEQGHAEAQLDLCVMHAMGVGVPRDRVRAYAWCSRAMAQSRPAFRRYRQAEDLRLRLEREMTPGQRDEARRLAGEAADR
jgi:hypothetical protein